MTNTTVKFFQCGGCDSYHPLGFGGDCRDDSNRFAPDELDEKYGSFGWEEVDEDALDGNVVRLNDAQAAGLRERFAAFKAQR